MKTGLGGEKVRVRGVWVVGGQHERKQGMQKGGQRDWEKAVRSGGDKESKTGRKQEEMCGGEVDEDDDGCRPEGFAVKVRRVY